MSSSWMFWITCSTLQHFTSHAKYAEKQFSNSTFFILAPVFLPCPVPQKFLSGILLDDWRIQVQELHQHCGVSAFSSESWGPPGWDAPFKVAVWEGKPDGWWNMMWPDILSSLVLPDIWWMNDSWLCQSGCGQFVRWKNVINEAYRWKLGSFLQESYFNMNMLAEIPANLEFAESRSCQGWTYFIAARTNVDETCTKGAEGYCRRVWKLQSSPSCSEFFIHVVLLIGGKIECWWPDGKG